MRPAPRLPALLAVTVLVLVGGVAAPIAAAGQSGASPGSAALDAPAAALDAPTNTTLEARLYANASARWTVRTTYLLEDDTEVSAFREYVTAYRAGEADAGPRADPFVAAADRAGVATGREMRVTNVSRRGQVDGAVGTVAVSFEWTNFLDHGENGTLRLDEALALGGDETWLGSLAANQALVVRTPPGYSITDSSGPSFEIESNAIQFEGPREFESRLTVTYRQTGPVEPEPPDRGLPWELLGGGALVVVAAALYARLRDGSSAPATDGERPDDGPTGPVDPEPTGGEASEPDERAADGDEEDSDPEPDPDPELLADDERVKRLLEQNGGRMKQAAIVEETGWSDAKVSQLLSSMADEGRVEKLRLGRENLISLPDDESG